MFVGAGDQNGAIVVWAINPDPAIVHEIPGPDFRVRGLAFGAPDVTAPGQWVAALVSDDQTVHLGQVGELNQTNQLQGPVGPMTAIALNQIGQVLAVANETSVSLWNIADPNVPAQLGQTIASPGGTITGIGLNGAGDVLAIGTSQNVTLWNVNDPNNALSTLPLQVGGDYSQRSVALSPDGQLLAVNDWNSDYLNKVMLWDVSNPAQPQPLGNSVPGHIGDVVALSFSADSGQLVSVSTNSQEYTSDSSLILWDVTTRRLIVLGSKDVVLNAGQGARFTGAAFRPDGQVVTSAGGALYEWDAQVNGWVEQACAIANRNLTEAEWRQFIGDTLPYEAVCANLPIGPATTTTP
jgi:WD40 repeat protein